MYIDVSGIDKSFPTVVVWIFSFFLYVLSVKVPTAMSFVGFFVQRNSTALYFNRDARQVLFNKVIASKKGCCTGLEQFYWFVENQ